MASAPGAKVDEHGLPRFPDGRRSVEVIHAPYLLELVSHVMPWVALVTYLVLSDVFAPFVKQNILVQLLVFVPSAHLPAVFTGKMSFIDLAWPLGLLAMGLEAWLSGTAPAPRRGAVAVAYFLIGARMTAFILGFFHVVVKGSELTRYQYRRLVWEERPFFGGLVRGTAASMQLEICEQWVWNASWLCLPAMLHAFDTEALSAPEAAGFALWAAAFALESLADKQKLAFVNDCIKRGEEARLRRTGGKVCNVGLWRYTRHPNYFFQWLGWVGLTLASVPAFLRLRGAVSLPAWLGFAAVLVYVPIGSYLMMIWYTGSIPMEVYTVQTRPEYKEYQRTTNMFFPWPPRAAEASNYVAVAA